MITARRRAAAAIVTCTPCNGGSTTDGGRGGSRESGAADDGVGVGSNYSDGSGSASSGGGVDVGGDGSIADVGDSVGDGGQNKPPASAAAVISTGNQLKGGLPTITRNATGGTAIRDSEGGKEEQH